MGRSRVAAVVPLLIGVSLSLDARAEQEAIKLTYQAPEGCPSRDEFSSEVSARTAEVRFVETDADRVFAVSIRTEGEDLVGSLEIATGGSPSATREIRGETCESVALAIAITTALAIDPEADTRPEPVAQTKTSPPAPAPVERPAAPRAKVKQVHGERPPLERRQPSGAHLDVGAVLTATWGPAPEPLITPAPFVQIELPGSGAWSPLFRAEAIIAESGVLGPDFDAATFRWYSLRVQACPLRWSPAGAIALRSCATLDAGAIHARGHGVADPRSQTRGWISPGLSGRFSWLWTRFAFVEASAGAQFALSRYDYVFQSPHRRIYQSPAVSPAFELGVGLRFF